MVVVIVVAVVVVPIASFVVVVVVGMGSFLKAFHVPMFLHKASFIRVLPPPAVL